MSSAPGAFTVSVAAPPKVYRAMKRSAVDNLPVTGTVSSSELGVRPGIDVTLDSVGNVVLDGTGMSVAPGWRDLDFTRIPKRLRHSVPGAVGANSTSCFRMGEGPFQNGFFANGLELVTDSEDGQSTHGVIAPDKMVRFARYREDLENTRSAWQIDEK